MHTTKEAFLRDFFDFDFSPDEIPSDWMADAWEIDRIRKYLTSDMTRMISKGCEIRYLPPFSALLVRSLTCEQIVGLYGEIRDGAHRHEDEWREGFEQMFARCAEMLPPPLLDPYHDWHLRGREFPWEWMEAAWADAQIRGNVVLGMARDLNRGDDAWCGPEWFDLLDRSLNRDQIIQLYLDLRDHANRPESEWRWAFEEYFPDCVKHLPNPLEG